MNPITYLYVDPAGPEKAAAKEIKTHKAIGIFISICLVLLGVLYIALPLYTSVAVLYIATAGFVLFGVYHLVVYAQTPTAHKNGRILANGILFLLLGMLVALSGAMDMLLTFAFLLGFWAIFQSVSQLSNCYALRKAGAYGCGWVMTSGILNIIMGVCFLLTPFAAMWALGYILGIYLIIGGVSLLAEILSGHHGKTL